MQEHSIRFLLMQRFCLTLLVLGVFASSLSECRTFQQDLDDLADIQDLVDSSNMTLRGWNSETDPCGDVVPCGINRLQPCAWEGLACLVQQESIHRIAGIFIEGSSNGRLTGTLPVRLPLLLRSISLPGNDLKGDLLDPECNGTDYRCSDIWWRNEELTSINLDGNDLEASLPEWSTLSRLESIQLSNNRINGTLPHVWGDKIYLRRIELSRNELTGVLPEDWSHLLALQFIRLAENHFHEKIPSGWLRLPSLVMLDLAGNCGICGAVPEENDFVIYGNGTNLNTDCSRCNGCSCEQSSKKFVWTNVLMSFVVLGGLISGWLIYRRCRPPNRSEQLPVTDDFPPPMPRKPQDPTIVINPDQDVCICCQIDEEPPEAETEAETASTYGISEGDSSDYDLDSDTGSLDPEVLAFLYKKSPMMALADRSWSEEIAGPSEVRAEGYVSDLDGRSSASFMRRRRTKSALEGRSVKNLSKNFIEARKSAKRVTELAPIPKRPRNKHRRRHVRASRRVLRPGLPGDFRIADPQRTIAIPDEVNRAISSMQLDSPSGSSP